MARKRKSADSDPLFDDRDAIRARGRAGTRRGLTGGVYGVSYVGQSYYLSPDQFGYTTSQAEGGYGGGSMTTTGSGGDGAGDGGGGGV